MAYDSVRAQLDKLLGHDRNGPLPATSAVATDYHHPDICKYFLLGFCPADLHIKHRSEPGSCKYRHSDSAKAAFERDLTSQRAFREKARWTAKLLSECQTIIADEDRRVRCHARRLKETYNVQGDLNGLIIQSFDTLKELGMVRKNARIRVLSEAGGEELNTDLVSEDPVDEERKQVLERDDVPVQPNNLHPRKYEAQAIPSGREVNDPGTKREGSDSCPPRDTGGGSLVVDEGDDDGDFGLIKVIPALNETQRDSIGPKTVVPITPSSQSSHLKHCHPEDSRTNHRDLSTRDESEQTREMKLVAHEKHRLENHSSAVDEKAPDAESTREGSPAKSRVDGSAVMKKSDNPGHEIVADAKPKSSSDDETPSLRDTPRMPLDDQEKQEGELDRMATSNKMDHFYKRGVGPDGLLMLDKKQSLRVCACCGGYISLVDAESRLLSHYGGKSHHSMSLLRQKVQQLEAQVSAEPRNWKPPVHAGPHSQDRFRPRAHANVEGRPLDFRHAKSPERKYGTKRSDRFDDRRRSRYRKDSRGFGTSDWYSNYLPENGEGQSSQWSDEHRNVEVGSHRQHQERSLAGKRHRSRSPIRGFRRTRRR